jgi:hypothetical protein
VAFTRQNPAFLRCYGFTVSSPRSQTLSPFLPSSESSSPSCCSTQGQLHWIDLIKICPLPPKSGPDPASHAPLTARSALALPLSVAMSALVTSSRDVSPSDVSDTSALVTPPPLTGQKKKKKPLSFTVFRVDSIFEVRFLIRLFQVWVLLQVMRLHIPSLLFLMVPLLIMLGPKT